MFFAYVIITTNEVRLYVQEPSRITPTIQLHFEEEGVGDEITFFDYDMAKSGLANVVSIYSL